MKEYLNKLIRGQFLLVAFAVPLSKPEGWHSLKFSSIKANEVAHSAEGLSINVDSSASPLIYKFPEIITVKHFRTTGIIKGNLIFKDKDVQGEKKTDDFQYRLGLVLKGDKRLNAFQRMVSPKWITTLFELAPKDQGINKIEFYNIASKTNSPSWKTRTHPLSDLMSENIIASQGEGVFDISYELSSEQKIAAIWLSSDGDQTSSKYNVVIKSIDFNPEPSPKK